jgi:hypothetical protein
MKKLIFTLMLSLIISNLKSQTVYQLNFVENYKNNVISSDGPLSDDTKLIINEYQKKITIIGPQGYKTQIFKILRKVTKTNEIAYYCEFENPNGTVQITLILDTFYRSLKCLSENNINDYVKYYLK